MHVHFELQADHADGVADAVLLVHPEFLREHVQNFAVFRQGDGARGVHGTADVFPLDIARPRGQHDSAAAIHAADVAAGHAHHGRFHGNPGDAFGLLERAANRTDRSVEIDDQALARTPGFRSAQAQKLGPAVLEAGDERARLGAADVQRDQVSVLAIHSVAP